MTDSRSPGAPTPRASGGQGQQNGVSNISPVTSGGTPGISALEAILGARSGGGDNNASSNPPHNAPPTIPIPPVVDHYDEK